MNGAIENVLQSKNGMDVEAEAEVNIEAGIGKLLVVVRRQTAHFIIIAWEDELAVLDGGQAEENGITGTNSEILYYDLLKQWTRL